MSGLSTAARPLKGGLALLDPATGLLQRLIVLQYTPEKLSRKLQPATAPAGGRSEPLRLSGPAVETIAVEAELDAADQLEFPDANPVAVAQGLYPVLSALEMVLHPSTAQLETNNRLMNMGTLEIVPMESALVLFVWGRNRILPVRITDLGVNEEEFAPSLVPIRARVSIGMRVLGTSDLQFGHRGTGLFMSHLAQKEALARKLAGTLSQLGLGGPP
ncbi:MAG TPA: hypothetical protein VF552_14700 [Allosphingosinicella sp.]|jgi:hypothetical protein